MADVDDQTANWLPPGKALPIGALYVHILQGEDIVINQMLQGNKTIWDSERWGRNLNLHFGTLKPEPRDFKADLAVIKPYAEATARATNAYLGSAHPPDLDRKIRMGSSMGDMSAGAIVEAWVIGHIWSHIGEISTLKGLQGKKGYPF
jgi:hypothetical protein